MFSAKTKSLQVVLEKGKNGIAFLELFSYYVLARFSQTK
jgi:hypothetical protein